MSHKRFIYQIGRGFKNEIAVSQHVETINLCVVKGQHNEETPCSILQLFVYEEI